MLISIITINFNHLPGLKKTVESVLRQVYENIEYIIIDGGSTDGSAEFIASHKNNVDYWISEADSGIYEAMNKGIDQASGEYLLFMNSGDWLENTMVIQNFIAFKPIDAIVYGDTLVQNNGKWVRKFMPKHMSVSAALTTTLCHQAIFYNRSVFADNYKYDASYSVISDWIFTNNAIIFKNSTTKYIDLVVCCFEDAGISGDFNLRNTERKRYLNENFDPFFLDFLKDYKSLKKEYFAIKNNRLVKIALWVNQQKGKLFKHFKK